MMPGIGLIKRRLETEAQAVALATSHILKEHNLAGGEKGKEGSASAVSTLETKYDADSGDWYVALGWSGGRRAVIQMDSILGTVTDVREV
ncbi:MAG: hypothetical protein J4F28_02330 [Nitrosopumilaceae archaeon]|nr:hypothetical protein [Nitrosopumilaceae archaeon]